MCTNCETHDHSNGVFGKYTELYFAIISGVFLVGGFLLETFSGWGETIPLYFYLVAYFFGGYFIFKEAIRVIAKGRFEIDFLMLVAAAGAGFLDKWAEGALLLFLFSLGHALEHYALGKARKSIAALTDLAPKTAFLKKGSEVMEVALEVLQIGDIIIAKPNSKIAADGIVVKGTGSVDQSAITGESIPVDKIAIADIQEIRNTSKIIANEHRVFSGTLNGDSLLEVQVEKVTADSTLSRLVTMVEEAQQQKSETQLLTDRFQRYYVPVVILLVFVLNFAFLVIDETWGSSFYRSMAVLVAASPCALAISTPAAVLSGIARAAKGGVLIKGGRPLEDLGALKTLAFDKTGTLTEGKPKLTDVIPLGNTTQDALLSIAIAVESLSDHPLAKAVVRDGKARLAGAKLPIAENLTAVHGKGLTAQLEGKKVGIGNTKLFEKKNEELNNSLQKLILKLEKEGKTLMLVQQEETFIGLLALMDVPRSTTKETIARLRQLGIQKMVMLTGDNQRVADAVANEIGLTEARGSLLPEEKVSEIQALLATDGKLAMVGDGVNDAPAMAHSTVGVAMGAAGSDVALETADIALMGDKLETLPFAIALSRKAHTIIRQNLWISLGMVALLVPATIFSWANIGVAVIFHEGSTLLVVLNALRLLAFKNR